MGVPYVISVETQLCGSCVKAAIDNTSMNEYSYVPVKLHLWSLKFYF